MSGDEPARKRQCSGQLTIGTHNGSFHCDEVLACFLLKQLPKYKHSEVIRTRDPTVLDTCDIVVDVGAVFNPETNRFDHHQRTFSECFNSLCPSKKWTTKLSSAGLVYLHFGKQILSQLLETKIDDDVTEIIYDKVYENFVEEIDGIDNGIDQFDGESKYQVSTNISNRVRNLNPSWNEKNVDEQKRFHEAMDMVGSEFMDRVLFYKNSWLPARDLVETAVNKRKQVCASGEIMVLNEAACPWKDHLFMLEEQEKMAPSIKYVLYQDSSNKWRIQCVPLRLGTFENRVSLPKEWQGVRDDALSEKSGIPGCIFVHANGFIGGNNTYEGVLEMARKSLQIHAEQK